MLTEKLSLKRKHKSDLHDLKTSEEEISSKLKKSKSSPSETAKVENAKSPPSEAGKVRILRSTSKTNNEKNDSSPAKNEAIIITRSSQKSETDSQISSPFQKITSLSTKIQNPSFKSSITKYFVCEHTTLIPEIKEDKGYFPRFARWSTTELIKVLERRQLDTLQDDEVNVLIGNFKQEEAYLLINIYENQFLDDIFEDVRETEINKLRLKIESLEKENLDLRKEVETSKEKLKDNDEGKNEDSVQRGNSDLGEEVQNLKEKLGQNDGGKDEEILNTEKQVQLLEYYCNETKSQFWESIENPMAKMRNERSAVKEDEEQTNEVTKTEKNIEAKSSISRGVKLRKRGKANLQPEKKRIPENKRRTRAQTSTKALESIEVEKYIDVPEVVKLKCVTKSEAWKLLDDKQKPIVEYFFKNENRNTEVWKSTKSDVIIYGATLENLMFIEPLNNSVIDWYSYKLQEEQESNSTKDYFFPAQTFTILSNGNKDLIEKCGVDVIRNIDPNFDYWFFPINTTSHNSNEGFYWTLLQVDTRSWEWFHYNTLAPRQIKGTRGNTNTCFKNAKQLRQMLMNIMKTCWPQDRFLKVNLNGKVQNIKCTQQNEIPNCALYVCHFMDMLSNNRATNEDDESSLAEKMQNLRADLAYIMLTDDETCYNAPAGSWIGL